MKNPLLLFRICIVLLLVVFISNNLTAQDAPKPEIDHSYKPLTVKLSEDGKNMSALLCGINYGLQQII